MKKLLSFLFVFTLVACGGNDDEGIDTDPIIGKWGGNCYDDSREYIHYRDDGIWIFYEALTDGSIMANHSGTWVNNGDDLTSDNQNYTIQADNLNVDPDSGWYGDDTDTEPVSFTANFNSAKNEYSIQGGGCVQRKIN